MRTKRTIPFEITGIDSLGQGVSKLGEKVTFIPKTAPGDKGTAVVMSEKKGVAFARVSELSIKSELRQTSPCVHFGSCPSCHFLHLTYTEELKFKKESYQRLFRKLPLPEVEIVAAPDRFNYRNRIQLHYSLKSKLLGMRDPETLEIIPIPQCLIGKIEVLQELSRLYQNITWLREAPPAPTEGHVEIYWIEDALKVSWNRPYAEGGFTQVYQLMNEKLKGILTDEWLLSGNREILDLFAGNGNLSDKLPYSQRLCVDLYQKAPGEAFLSQNLYGKDAMKNVIKDLKRRNMNPENLLLDPPRSGLKDLSVWIETLKPEKIAYVSCDPHTLARDLMTIKDYVISRAFLIDFFPSTFHFESMIFLERKR